MGDMQGHETVVLWPQRQLYEALKTTPTDQTLWLYGFYVSSHALCVVGFTTDRFAVNKSLDVVGVGRVANSTTSQAEQHDAKLLVVEWNDVHGDADALDRSLRIVAKGMMASPSVVILYDPQLFMHGNACGGIEAMASASPLKAPLQKLQSHFEAGTATTQSLGAKPFVTACEALAYYSMGLPFAIGKMVWEKTLLTFLLAPLLRSFPIGRGTAITDYSQCVRVFVHRLSNILTLPAQVRARYRLQPEDGSYTELSDFMLYLVVDYALGLVFSSFVLSTALPAATARDITPLTFLDTLREHVFWLMDAPAGFKLNDRLAAILSNGILMWLDFWEFLLALVVTSSPWQAAISSPMLCAIAFQCWKHAGLTLQLSAVADAVWLMTWNSYWVFLYFTKLNAMQLRLLSSLWKLFLGKKNNVLRKRVDSCEYDVNQLLLGTLLFTILVFLVTTNAVFFVFFGLVRFSVWLISAALWLPIVLLRGFPIVSVLHRLLRPRQYTASLSIETVDDQLTTDSLIVQDISPSRRRDRDLPDRTSVRDFVRQQTTSGTSRYPVLFRIVTRPSGLSQRFHRLAAYQTQVTRSYNSSAIVKSCLFGAEITPVDASVLFRTATSITSTIEINSKPKHKTE